jgi:hypothetical protein
MKTKNGIINLYELNDRLIQQDVAFRDLLESTRTTTMTEEAKQTMILAEGLAVIHERLGNLITLTLSHGGS